VAGLADMQALGVLEHKEVELHQRVLAVAAVVVQPNLTAVMLVLAVVAFGFVGKEATVPLPLIIILVAVVVLGVILGTLERRLLRVGAVVQLVAVAAVKAGLFALRVRAARMAVFVLFGPAQLAHSHLQMQEAHK
jgi:hypothetical protein